ncbi:MAG: cobalamin biosynthesis protein, partial [Clostridia bacterium]|nr:cobalamin biosynthesis protein [Clostridia bacterium]
MKELFLLHIVSLVIGFLLDALLGDPTWLYHPVIAIGKYISFLEKRLRKWGGNLRKSAVLLTASTVLITMFSAGAILAPLWYAGKIWLLIGMSLLDWLGLAARSMV